MKSAQQIWRWNLWTDRKYFTLYTNCMDIMKMDSVHWICIKHQQLISKLWTVFVQICQLTPRNAFLTFPRPLLHFNQRSTNPLAAISVAANIRFHVLVKVEKITFENKCFCSCDRLIVQLTICQKRVLKNDGASLLSSILITILSSHLRPILVVETA